MIWALKEKIISYTVYLKVNFTKIGISEYENWDNLKKLHFDVLLFTNNEILPDQNWTKLKYLLFDIFQNKNLDNFGSLKFAVIRISTNQS